METVTAGETARIGGVAVTTTNGMDRGCTRTVDENPIQNGKQVKILPDPFGG